MKVDVAIIGGGPTGCSAALTLLACGLSVAVFSVDAKKEKPTETSAPTLKSQLRSLGAGSVLDTCWPCYGIESNWGRQSPHTLPSLLNPHGNSWFVDRLTFDGALKQLVKSKGAVWIDACVQDVQVLQGGVWFQTQGQECAAKFLIAANGSPFWCARLTSQTTDVLDSLIAFWATVPSENTSRFFSLETTEYGWWYVCPGKNQSVSVCLVTDGECAQTMRPNVPTNWTAMFEATKLKKQFKVYDKAASIRSSVIYQATLPQQVGSSWIASGDAAHKLDPLGSAGTAAGLASGQRAARAVSDVIMGNKQSLAAYQSNNANLFTKFTVQRQQQYGIEAKRRKEGFWSRRLSGRDDLIYAVANS